MPEAGRGYAAALLIVLLFALQAAIRFSSEINHDTGWYIHVAQGLLNGKELYRDFVEVNPPLSMWLTVPPVAFARLTGLQPDWSIYLLHFALTGLTLLLGNRYLRALPEISDAARHILLVLIAAILLFAPGPDFGQREHMMVLFILPWLLLRLARGGGFQPVIIEAVAAGILAAIAVALKPHALLAVLLPEAFLLIRSRAWRILFAPEVIAAVAFVIAYGLAVVLWTPLFLSEMLQLGVEAYVPYYGRSMNVLMERSLRAVLMLAAAGALMWLARKSRQDTAAMFLLAAVGFLASYFFQAKGYIYHLLPAMSFAAMAAAAAFAPAVTASEAKPMERALPSALLVLCLFLAWKPQAYVYAGQPFEQAIDEHKPGAKSVLIASTNVFQAFPMVVKRKLAWTSRYPTQWLAPYVSHRWQQGPMPSDPIIAAALANAVDDIAAGEPDIVFIDTRLNQDYVRDGRFDFLGFYAQDPRFAAIWSAYEKRGEVAGFDVYVRSGG